MKKTIHITEVIILILLLQGLSLANMMFISADRTTNLIDNSKQQSVMLSSSEIEWSKFFGGGQLDWGWDVQQTYDGGYIIVGETTSFGAGGYDAWLIKTDKDGCEEWNKTFGGYLKDGARSVLIMNDSCIIMAGYTDSYGHGSAHDFWLIKTDDTGDEVWNRTYGSSHSEAGFSVSQTHDGGFVITGYTYSFGAGANDIWLIKTDFNGYELWNTTFGGPQSEYGMSVQQTTDQGFIIAGSTSSFGEGKDDGWLIKTDVDGNELWNITTGGEYNDWFGSVAQTHDSGFIITGDTASFSTGGYDAWFIKINNSGMLQWQTVLGDAFFHETGYSVQETIDAGFISTGSTTSFNTSLSDLWVRKLNASGSEQWCLTFQGAQNDCGYSICSTKDSGSVVTGYSDSFNRNDRNVILLKLLSDTENLPPESPMLMGPSRGSIGTSYNFSSSTKDIDNDCVYFWFDWGDTTNSGWLGPYNSGQIISLNHSYHSEGTYMVKAKAKDIIGAESDWATLTVTMPYSYRPLSKFFDVMFQRFPNAFPLLQQLMGC